MLAAEQIKWRLSMYGKLSIECGCFPTKYIQPKVGELLITFIDFHVNGSGLRDRQFVE